MKFARNDWEKVVRIVRAFSGMLSKEKEKEKEKNKRGLDAEFERIMEK